MGNAAGSLEVSQGKDGKPSGPGSMGPQRQTTGAKLPMPPEEELEERFNAVLVSRECMTSCCKWKNKSATVERNKECGICWKCARPRDKLIVVPGTQSCCGKIHKSSFMLRLTAALGLLLPVRERMIRGSQVCLQLRKSCLYSLLLYLSTYTSTYKSLMYQCFTNERRLSCQKYPWVLGKRQRRLGHMLHHIRCLMLYLVKYRCLKFLISLLKVITLLFL